MLTIHGRLGDITMGHHQIGQDATPSVLRTIQVMERMEDKAIDAVARNKAAKAADLAYEHTLGVVTLPGVVELLYGDAAELVMLAAAEVLLEEENHAG